MGGKLMVVVGGQFGSEAKGHVAGYLSARESDLLAVRVGGPNAGHTVIDESGGRWALRQVPVAAITNTGATLAVAAGSEVDLEVLEGELARLGGYRDRPELWVDGQATVLSALHAEAEGSDRLTERVGSTGKGVGAARAERLWRRAKLVKDEALPPGAQQGDVASLARARLARGGSVLIEAAQGYGLGLHAGFYPFCTSGDCRAIDALAAVGLSPWDPAVVRALEVWVVLRTYPIRVAGHSGPLRGELTWEQLAKRTDGYIQPERTTVTQKIRRVGAWDRDLARAAVEANGGRSVRVAVTMLDYLWPSVRDQARPGPSTAWWQAERWVTHRQHELGATIYLMGTGPGTMVETKRSR